MQTSLRRRHHDRVVRRGIGMMIESECAAAASNAPRRRRPCAPALTALPSLPRSFYSTQAGRDHFRDQLQSIRYW